MKIYIIEAEQGEYSDRQQWIVKVFRSKKKAEKLTNELNDRAKKLTDKFTELRSTIRRWDHDLSEWAELFEDSPDPMLKHNFFHCKYYCYDMEIE